MPAQIPFHKPFIAGRELDYIQQAVHAGSIAGDGPFTRRCTEILERRFGVGKALLTSSCTAALEIAAALCGLGPGDEAILPSYTYVSTASAVARTGARPVFVDIRPDTLNLDVSLVEQAITPRTKAVFAVHYAGVACEMDALAELARRHNLSLVEDAAQGVNAFYKNRALGSLGRLGAYSFHETKNYTCGEGGALCVNLPEWIERAEILHDKGTDRPAFLRGETDYYTWVDLGSAYGLSEIASAFLCAQLEQLDHIAQRRRRIYETYCQLLQPLEAKGRIRTPVIPPECRSNHHMFYVLLPDRAARDSLLDYLRRESIQAAFHYIPLHGSPVGRRLGYRRGDLPVTEQMSGRLMRLPFFHQMTDEEQARVAECITRFFQQAQR